MAGGSELIQEPRFGVLVGEERGGHLLYAAAQSQTPHVTGSVRRAHEQLAELLESWGGPPDVYSIGLSLAKTKWHLSDATATARGRIG